MHLKQDNSYNVKEAWWAWKEHGSFHPFIFFYKSTRFFIFFILTIYSYFISNKYIRRGKESEKKLKLPKN